MRTIWLAFLLGCILVNPLNGQQTEDLSFEETVGGLFKLQQHYFPQEKAYLHFDRNHYVAGDTLWFRGYVLNAASHRPDTLSRFLYVDLLSPTDSVFLKAKIIRINNTYAGYFPLPDNTREGNYTLRAYTLFMRNSGEEYFFRAPVRISDPFSAAIRTDVSFEIGDNKTEAQIRFRERHNPQAELSHKMELGVGNEAMRTFSDKNGVFPVSLKRSKNKRDVLRVDYEKSQQYMEIPAPDDVFDVAFFPEGGYLIDKTLCTVGFKAVNAYGLGENVSGKIVDQNGNVFAEFRSEYKGIGHLSFIPEAGKKYYAECLNDKGYSMRVELPQARNDAIALKVLHNNGKWIISAVKPAGSDRFNDLHLVIHTRGEVQYIVKLGDGSRPLTLQDGMLPSGISSILLVDESRNILSERLLFCFNNDTTQTLFKTDKRNYGRRDRIKASVTLTDENGVPVRGMFSVAVTDDQDVTPDSAANILTNLLLTSDLQGYIEEPAWYFSGSPEAFDAMNCLMLTQGWKRYDIPEMMQGNLKQIDYDLEYEISGRVKTAITAKPAAETKVVGFVKDLGLFVETLTDEQGYFKFDNVIFSDSANFRVQAFPAKENGRLMLELNPVYSPKAGGIVPTPEPKKTEGLSPDSVTLDDSYAYITKADQKWVMENGMRTIHFEALEIKANQSMLGGYEEQSIYSAGPGFTDAMYTGEELDVFVSFSDLLSWDSQVTMDMARMGLTDFDSLIAKAMIIIDDTPWKDINSLDQLEGVWPFQMIKRVEYLRSTNVATLMFSMEGQPVLIITTKKNDPNREFQLDVKTLGLTGYQVPVEFYAPKYETARQKNNTKTDLRTTIYWNPDVSTDLKGNASFEFYAADANTTYSVVIEGITQEGKIIRKVEKIERQ